MIKWYFKWRFKRSQKADTYRIDKRLYKPLFGPGFWGHLQSSRFWDKNLGKYETPYRRRCFILLSIVIIVIGVGFWIVIESIQAINLF